MSMLCKLLGHKPRRIAASGTRLAVHLVPTGPDDDGTQRGVIRGYCARCDAVLKLGDVVIPSVLPAFSLAKDPDIACFDPTKPRRRWESTHGEDGFPDTVIPSSRGDAAATVDA